MRNEIDKMIDNVMKEEFNFGIQQGKRQTYEAIYNIIDDMFIEKLIEESQYNELRKRIRKFQKGEYKINEK